MPKGTDSRNDPRRKVGRPIIEPIREATFGPDVPRPGTGPRRELRQDASGTFHIVDPESPDKSIPLVNELDPDTFQPKKSN